MARRGTSHLNCWTKSDGKREIGGKKEKEIEEKREEEKRSEKL